MLQKVGFFEISIENPLGPGGSGAHDCWSRGVPWVEKIENFRLSRSIVTKRPKKLPNDVRSAREWCLSVVSVRKAFWWYLWGVSRGHLVGFFDVCT